MKPFGNFFGQAGYLLFSLTINLNPSATVFANELADTLSRVKPSIVGIGTFSASRSPSTLLVGTGFVVGHGLHVLTNAHVIPETIDHSRRERLTVFVRNQGKVEHRNAKNIAVDNQHDLAILNITGPALTPLKLGDSSKVREGELYAFTGFPLGIVLGLYPVTHHGIISAISPIVIPAHSSNQLNADMVRRLQAAYSVFQLDATAYPGNSGSPLYDTRSGQVVGILNKVFIQQSKENLLSQPSGISYAIPIQYAKALLKAHDIRVSH